MIINLPFLMNKDRKKNYRRENFLIDESKMQCAKVGWRIRYNYDSKYKTI